MNAKQILFTLALTTCAGAAWAKIPPPPADPVAVAAKAEKDKAAAEKGKVLQAAAEDRAVKNFQANRRKAGKSVPKPTPIVTAAAPAAAKAPAQK